MSGTFFGGVANFGGLFQGGNVSLKQKTLYATSFFLGTDSLVFEWGGFFPTLFRPTISYSFQVFMTGRTWQKDHASSTGG